LEENLIKFGWDKFVTITTIIGIAFLFLWIIMESFGIGADVLLCSLRKHHLHHVKILAILTHPSAAALAVHWLYFPAQEFRYALGLSFATGLSRQKTAMILNAPSRDRGREGH
jgi:hypothetical protein